jgi:hypothetical protein
MKLTVACCAPQLVAWRQEAGQGDVQPRNFQVIEIPDTLMAAVLYTPTIDPPTGALDAFVSNIQLRATSQIHNATASRLQMLRTSRSEVGDLRNVIADATTMLHETLH